MRRYFPFLEWIPAYRKQDFSGDLAAGLTVGVMLIPQGMAYAVLAGLPAIYGLYASTVALIVYALFGSSRKLAVGPMAMVSLMVASGVGGIVEGEGGRFIELAIVLGLLVGFIQLIFGLLRLGFVIRWLSKPVIGGFTSAVALVIAASQLKDFLRLEIPRGQIYETLASVWAQWGGIHWPTFLFASIALLLLVIMKRIHRRIPGALVVVVLGMLGVGYWQLDVIGIEVIGFVPEGLPAFGLPVFSIQDVYKLLPSAFAISLVGFIGSYSIAKVVEEDDNEELDENQELIGLGLANLGGALFQGFPITGSLSRTAINSDAGARTGLASIISGALIVFTLLYLTPYFYYLPKAVLAAIIMASVLGLVDIKEVIRLWKANKKGFVLFVGTAIGTLVFGIEEGVLLGIGLEALGRVWERNKSYP